MLSLWNKGLRGGTYAQHCGTVHVIHSNEKVEHYFITACMLSMFCLSEPCQRIETTKETGTKTHVTTDRNMRTTGKTSVANTGDLADLFISYFVGPQVPSSSEEAIHYSLFSQAYHLASISASNRDEFVAYIIEMSSRRTVKKIRL